MSATSETIGIVGAGWLGLPLGQALVEQGYTVWGTTTTESKLPKLAATGLQPVLFAPGSGVPVDLPRADIVIITLPPRGGEAAYSDLLNRLIQWLSKSGVKKVLYCSSTSVYPDENRIMGEEDAEMIVSKHSGVRLLAMENLFRTHTEFQTTVLRFGGLYGPGRHPGRFLAGKTDLPGAANPVNMIRLEDCVGIISTIIEKNAWGQTWNAVAPQHPTRQEFYARAAAEGGFAGPTWSEEGKPWKEVSSDRLVAELGYSFLFPEPGGEW